MTLQYLLFDYSDNAEEAGSFDAMASVLAPQVDAVQAEVAQVLAWAESQFPGQHGPIEEGGEWDHDLQTTREQGTPERIVFSLSITGTRPFCEAFREHFDD